MGDIFTVFGYWSALVLRLHQPLDRCKHGDRTDRGTAQCIYCRFNAASNGDCYFPVGNIAYMLKAASATEKACKQQKGPSVPAGTASGPLQSGPSGFKFNPPGQLQTNTGQGDSDGTVYAPGMRFPIEKPNAYANSQVYRRGGGDQGGDQCKAANYSYPWSDNFCEIRDRTTPLCPAGKGHQGQDIRPNS